MAQKQQPKPQQSNEKMEALEKRVASLESVLRGYFRHTHYDSMFKV